ncbi:hypothetical protein GH868_30105, partial [Bacillus thuringiensis]|nr:hypothetical protein [Bacillus thuringiensis]
SVDCHVGFEKINMRLNWGLFRLLVAYAGGSTGVRPSYCYLPVVLRLCKTDMPSWFYNARTGLCQKFMYGNSGGNSKRLSTVRPCSGSSLSSWRKWRP